MATKAQRIQSLLDAATNRATPQSLAVQLADAIAVREHIDPAGLTLTQKADLILTDTRRYWAGVIKASEGGPVAAAATASNNALIDTNFSETP